MCPIHNFPGGDQHTCGSTRDSHERPVSICHSERMAAHRQGTVACICSTSSLSTPDLFTRAYSTSPSSLCSSDNGYLSAIPKRGPAVPTSGHRQVAAPNVGVHSAKSERHLPLRLPSTNSPFLALCCLQSRPILPTFQQDDGYLDTSSCRKIWIEHVIERRSDHCVPAHAPHRQSRRVQPPSSFLLLYPPSSSHRKRS